MNEGEILATLPLAVAGLMSEENFLTVYKQLKVVNNSLLQLGALAYFNAFLTLSFLSLPVIPKLKITDCGLFNMEEFRHIEVPVSD